MPTMMARIGESLAVPRIFGNAFGIGGISPSGGFNGVTGGIGRTTRLGGGQQLTIDGHPVYTFVGDTAPGQTNGQGITIDGGLWTVVSPAGSPVTGDSGSSSAAY